MVLFFQIADEVGKLLELKAKLGDEQQPKRFMLKCPKVLIITHLGFKYTRS